MSIGCEPFVTRSAIRRDPPPLQPSPRMRKATRSGGAAWRIRPSSPRFARPGRTASRCRALGEARQPRPFGVFRSPTTQQPELCRGCRREAATNPRWFFLPLRRSTHIDTHTISRQYGDDINSGPRNQDDDNDGFTVYDDDGEDITKGLSDDDYKRPTPSTIPNENDEYNF